jgi:hypothetical protein
MVETASRLIEEVGRPVDFLQDLVSDHKGQVIDAAGEVGQRARDLPDLARRTGRRGMRQTRKLAKKAARNSRRAPPTRWVGPLATVAVGIAVVAAIRIYGGRRHEGPDGPDSQP